MASKLIERDLNILDANDFDIVGNKPYEDGRWGNHSNRDFVHLQLFDANNNLMYMSRSPIPGSKSSLSFSGVKKKQVCIYSFPKLMLKKFGTKRKKTFFENFEDIEILRFLEMGYNVKMFNIKQGTIAVDTIADARKVKKLIRNEK